MITGMTKQQRAETVEDWRRTSGEKLNTPLASELEPTMRGTRRSKATRAFNVVCDARTETGRHQ